MNLLLLFIQWLFAFFFFFFLFFLIFSILISSFFPSFSFKTSQIIGIYRDYVTAVSEQMKTMEDQIMSLSKESVTIQMGGLSVSQFVFFLFLSLSLSFSLSLSLSLSFSLSLSLSLSLSFSPTFFILISKSSSTKEEKPNYSPPTGGETGAVGMRGSGGVGGVDLMGHESMGEVGGGSPFNLVLAMFREELQYNNRLKVCLFI